MYTKVNGTMIRVRAMAFICMLTELSTKESGSRISSMEREKNSGRMGLSLRASITVARRMGLDATIGLTSPFTRASGKRT